MNADRDTLEHFDRHAAQWWDREGEFRTLHHINPLRVDYIDARAKVADKAVLDVGCGGGLVAEAMAARGAQVTGIDLAQASLQVARLHLLESGLSVDYRAVSAEVLATERSASFDVVVCLELLEHVPEPASIVHACARLVRPGGHVFFSTLNRTPKSFALAIVGAEYLMRLVPRGTHRYADFIRPSELAAMLRAAGLTLKDVNGFHYNPWTQQARLCRAVDVNYLVWGVKE